MPELIISHSDYNSFSFVCREQKIFCYVYPVAKEIDNYFHVFVEDIAEWKLDELLTWVSKRDKKYLPYNTRHCR